MAQSTRTILIDDITGKEIEDGSGESIEFSVNGTSYTIDLDSKGAAKFHSTLQFYVEHATRLGRAPRGGKRMTKRSVDADPAAVRAWAESNGFEVSPRGRIKAEILEAYRAAGN